MRMSQGLYLAHPDLWVLQALGYKLDPWQKRVMRKLFTGEKNRISVRAGHGVGKTKLSSIIAHYFLMNFVPSKIIVSGPCVEENEKILLADGRWEKVKDLNGRYFGVLAVRDDLTFKPSLANCFPNGIKPVFRLTTRSGREAIRTGNHPFRTLNGWTPLSNLKIGDFIAIPTDLPAYGRQSMDENEVKFIAYMIAEGCTSKLDCGHITFFQNPGQVLEEFKTCVNALDCELIQTDERSYNIIGKVKTSGGRGINPLKELCREYNLDGKRSWEKRIPPQIFELNNNLLRIFLSRLFAGDGYVRSKGIRELGYATTSRELIHDINRLILRFGIAGRVRCRKKEKITPGSKSKKDCYFWYVCGEDAVKFIEEIGVFGHEKQAERIRNIELGRHRATFFENLPPQVRNQAIGILAEKNIPIYKMGVFNNGKTITQEIGKRIGEALNSDYFRSISKEHIAWDEVTSIEYVGEKMTYGIEVEKYHTYVTDFIEHNTGKQTRTQFWSYLNDAWNDSVFKDDIEWQRTKMFVRGEENEENWFATWVSSKNPKNMEGYHGPLGNGRNLLWIIEEAKGVQDAAFEALSGALSGEDNFLYISSTCGSPTGHFYKSHMTLKNLYETEHIPSTESPRVSEKQIDIWRSQYGGEDSPIFQARVMANFPDDDEFAVVSLQQLEKAVEGDDDYGDLDEKAA